MKKLIGYAFIPFFGLGWVTFMFWTFKRWPVISTAFYIIGMAVLLGILSYDDNYKPFESTKEID